MSMAKFSTKGYHKEEIKQNLKVDEYVFEIDGKDINNTHLIYSIGMIESTIYKAGKKSNIIREPSLNIELNGKDKAGNEAWISFDLKIDIDYLNTLSMIPTNITDLLHGSDSFIKKPNEALSEFLDFELPRNNEEDIYRNFSSLWVSKTAQNEFIFKLSVPNVLFTYFKLITKKEEL